MSTAGILSELELLSRFAGQSPDSVFDVSWDDYQQVPSLELSSIAALLVGVSPAFANVEWVMTVESLVRNDQRLFDFVRVCMILAENVEPLGTLLVVVTHENKFRSRIRLTDFSRWADAQGWNLPPNFPRGNAASPNTNRLSLPTAASGIERDAPPVSVGPDVDTTGLVAWQAAIFENLGSITEKYGSKMTARKVLMWCRTHGPVDVFPKEQPDTRNSFVWIDREGSQHTTQQGTVNNFCTGLRATGKIPAK
jgi:hypothetical protein